MALTNGDPVERSLQIGTWIAENWTALASIATIIIIFKLNHAINERNIRKQAIEDDERGLHQERQLALHALMVFYRSLLILGAINREGEEDSPLNPNNRLYPFPAIIEYKPNSYVDRGVSRLRHGAEVKLLGEFKARCAELGSRVEFFKSLHLLPFIRSLKQATSTGQAEEKLWSHEFRLTKAYADDGGLLEALESLVLEGCKIVARLDYKLARHELARCAYRSKGVVPRIWKIGKYEKRLATKPRHSDIQQRSSILLEEIKRDLTYKKDDDGP